MSETGKEKKIEPSRILNLPVSKKIELAQVAEREVRAVLITDSNKQVQEAVLTSPRITEVEIVAIAKSHKLDWIHKQYFANKSVTEKKVKFLFEGFSHKPNTTSKVSMVLWLCVRSQSCQSGFN